MIEYRLATIDDAEGMTRQRNMYRENFFDSREISIEDTQRFLEKIQNDPLDNMYILTSMGKEVGQCSIYDIVIGSHAEFGRLLKYAHGLRSPFLSACDHIIHTMMGFYRLKKMFANTLYTNKKALHFFADLGFSVEGIIYKEDVPHYFVMERR